VPLIPEMNSDDLFEFHMAISFNVRSQSSGLKASRPITRFALALIRIDQSALLVFTWCTNDKSGASMRHSSGREFHATSTFTAANS
jgi:hypothetical protein